MFAEIFLSLDFVRFYLHFHPDSSNLDCLFADVLQQSRRELTELRGDSSVIGHNNKGP